MQKKDKINEELSNLMNKYDKSVQRAWKEIAKIEGNNSYRQNMKISKVRETIMQEVAKNDN